MRRKVYIPNKGAGHDYSQAAKFGDLSFVTVGSINPYNTGQLYRRWVDALKDSDKNDYIVMTSLNIICSVGAAIFARKHGRVNFLLYTNKGDYKIRRIMIEEKK